MKYVEPIKFNSKSIVNNPTVKRNLINYSGHYFVQY